MPAFLMTRRSIVALIVALTGLLIAPMSAAASDATFSGTLSDGAQYVIQKPSNWNGTLLLYSHGYVVPGSSNPAKDVGDPATGAVLLAHGFALAGSSYSTTGWAIQQAIPDQIETLDKFNTLVGVAPTRTIAWGHSLGGMITAGLIQTHPERFTAALPMCGVVAGGVGVWNEGLDAEFAIKELLAPASALQLVNITSANNLNVAESILAQAQASPQGRARLALAAAVSDAPGWFDPLSQEPAATDFAAREVNQFQWVSQVTGPFAFALRAELEARAGGNPSWNTGVNYRSLLANSIDRVEVAALYKAAGLSLDDDLTTLARAPRISANQSAVDYLTKYIVFNGQLSGKPVLTLHTTGDGLVLNQDEQAYRSVVQDAGDNQLLRQIFVHRAGHCTFTPAETIVALNALLKRVNSGKWSEDGLDPAALNAAATALGPLNTLGNGTNIPPAYVDFKPTRFLRPFDLGND